MRDELLKFFAVREEKVTMGGAEYTVRTMPDDKSISGDDAIYQMAVYSTFDADGKPVFGDEGDIEKLRAAPRVVKAPLLAAVSRVNGLDTAAEEKNSDAGPSSG